MPNDELQYVYLACYWQAACRFAVDLCGAVARGELSPTMAVACLDYVQEEYVLHGQEPLAPQIDKGGAMRAE